MSPEFLLAVLTQLATAAGVYAALRADLARAVVTAQHARESAEVAHRRIDALKQ